MKKHLYNFLSINLLIGSVMSSTINNIDEDPWLRSWLFVGPFDNYEMAQKTSDSLSNSSFEEISSFASMKDNLDVHTVSSSSTYGTHSIYQYFPGHNEKYVIGFCKILSIENQTVYYNQLIHSWDALTFYIGNNQIVNQSRESDNYKSLKIVKGKTIGRVITEVKPDGLNYFNDYYNNFKIGLFKTEYSSKLMGRVTYNGQSIPDAKISLNDFNGLSTEVMSDSLGMYEFTLLNESNFTNIQIIAIKDDKKFYGSVQFLKRGTEKLINIPLKIYETEISGKVLTLYKDKSQPNVLVNLINSNTNTTAAQTFTDNSGNFYFNHFEQGTYVIKVDTKDGSYYALDNSAKKEIVFIGPGNKKVKNIEIKTSLINRGSWKQTDFISGLKSNYISHILTDSRNRVWYACHTGISVFDGNEYINIGTKDGLPFMSVNKIFEDSNGNIFAALRHSYAGAGGLYIIDDNYKIIDFLKEHGVQSQGIETITEDDNGNLIFSGWMGLYIYDGNDIKHFKYGDGVGSGQIHDILIDKNNYWLATTDGFVHYAGSEFKNHRVHGINSNIRKVFKSPSGQLFISPVVDWRLKEFGLYKYDGFQFQPVNSTKFISNVHDIVFDENGGMFFNSGQNFIHYNGENNQAFSPKWSTNTDMTWISTMEKAQDGTIKIGTWESGVWEYNMESISVISEVDGIEAWVNAMEVDNNNNLWVSTRGDGVYKIINNKIIRNYTMNDGLPSNDVRDLELDNFGNIWATSPAGLISISGDSIEVYNHENGFFSPDMYSIEIDNKGTVWVSGEQFLSSMAGDIVINYSRTNDTTRFHGYNAGLLVLDNGDVLHGGTNLKLFKKDNESYSFETLVKDNWINGIQLDSNKNILYSDAYAGIVKIIEGKKVFTHNTENGFLFDEPTTIYVDDNNWIWSASQSGGVGFYDGNIWSYLNTEDGLLGNNVHRIVSDKEGNYYFAHRIGITRYRPRKREGFVSIDKVSTSKNDYTGIFLNEIKSLINERIRFSFTSRNSNYRPGKDNFIYTIKSGDWHDSGFTNNAYLEWYPPQIGEYAFSVKSVDRDLNYSRASALKLSILNPWYLRYNYLFPFLGFISLILYATYSSTTRYLKQKKFNEKLRLDSQKKDKEARKTLEKKNKDLLESQEAAEAANEAKSTFLANMSHELRTPLNAIIGYSEMLIEDAEDENEDFIPDLDKINSSGKHLLGLINDILDLSKVESGKMELYIEEFDLQKTLGEIESTIKPLVEKNSNTFELVYDIGVKAMKADVTKVRQILLNLLSNSSKFTKAGVIKVHVKDSDKIEQGVDFIIEDTGIGMSPDQVEKVFQPFTQADEKTTRKFGGTGLGLTITKMFAEMMDGSIDVKSIEGEGTTFTVRLPLEVIDKAAIISDESSSIMDDDKEYTILVIDDDDNAQDMMKRFLEKQGYNVIQAKSGEMGLKLATEHMPDLITLDVMMPEMDGWEVLTVLQSNEVSKKIPVIMLTMANEPDIGYSLGATDYLTKPVDWNELSNILSKHQIDSDSQTVLIVEDDETTRQMLRKSLETNDFKVRTAHNGKKGLEKVKQFKPGLILLDLMMPEMDGFEFAEKLREKKEWMDIPVVVITAKDLTKEDLGRLKGNVEAIMQKGSYSKNELLSEVGDRIKKLKKTRK